MNNESGSMNLDMDSYRLIACMNLMVFLVFPSKYDANCADPVLVSCICASTFVNKEFVLYNIFYCICCVLMGAPLRNNASNMHFMYQIYIELSSDKT